MVMGLVSGLSLEKRIGSRALSASQPLDQGFQPLEEYLSAS